jgi:serine/threonine protein kinase
MLYYSPEIISGQKYYGPEIDCWCLGIILFRMTTGFEPFSHANSKSHLHAFVQCHSKVIKSKSEKLWENLKQMYAQDISLCRPPFLPSYSLLFVNAFPQIDENV